jgi:cyclopropane fatty-acyl-phospholipid synthase-like methyltransferase
MQELYTEQDSDYLKLTDDWHAKDSPWKAKNVYKILKKNLITSKSIVEVGCGVGDILVHLNKEYADKGKVYEGYDIAVDAINLAKKKETENISFHLKDFTASSKEKKYDVLLMMDVFEHVPDYYGFIKQCSSRATYKVYHIPLDIHVSSIVRNKMIDARKKVGHIHYFSKNTALASIEDTGQEIIDYFYTDGSIATPEKSISQKLGNIPRKVLFPIMPDLLVSLIGGYSLIVLAK